MRVALTFDAEHPDQPGGSPENATRILDTLDGRRATFFVQGRWARSEPEIARRIVDEGHLVGNHSNCHARAELMTEDGFRQDVLEGEQAILEVMGVDPRPWYRLPNGAGHRDGWIDGILGALGYRETFWTLAVEDWAPERTASQIAGDVVNQIHDGTVVLLHTWPTHTADVVPEILERLNDVTFVGIDELDVVP